MRVELHDVQRDFRGFAELIALHVQVADCQDTVLEVDMSKVEWMAAHMCAALAAILFPLYHERNIQIALPNMKPQVERILQKNRFLPRFGFNRPERVDTYGTTIEYQHFGPSDSESFKGYVARHFVGKGIPNMSQMLHRRFRESISEIFDNAVEHSRTQLGIFACGQHFPHLDRLHFSIADLGIGMRRNILERTGRVLTPEHAIEWALAGQNTTRLPKDRKPGGLGLKLIKEFVKLNGGAIGIASDAGYWWFRTGREGLQTFPAPFPGTVVNIEINTADTQSYCLASEIDPNGIF